MKLTPFKETKPGTALLTSCSGNTKGQKLPYPHILRPFHEQSSVFQALFFASLNEKKISNVTGSIVTALGLFRPKICFFV